MNAASPFSRPLYVMLKPVGSRCNLSCRYCYYLEKAHYYDETADFRMSDAALEEFVRQYLEAQTSSEVLFIWHGGEPLLCGLDFYKYALSLQQKYAGGRHIDNCIQTNGTLITEEWCRFFKENNFLVGVSIDGPKHFHDAYRCRSYDAVVRGIELLNKHDVQWNAMAVVNNLNVEYPLEFYRFFRDELNCRYLQFTPIVERVDEKGRFVIGNEEGKLTETSISSKQWGAFLCAIFDEWVQHDVGEMFVQMFDATLVNWCGVPPGICSLAPTCGHSAAMEHNGDLFSCDHFVFPQHLLGNIRTNSITSMMYGDQQKAFGLSKCNELTRQCKECQYLFACNGECPKNRFALDEYGNFGHNHLCAGYLRYFRHVAPAMDYMAEEWLAGREVSSVMKNIKCIYQ
ncbi:MAG: anaerobic sulfatase-maturation protein [Prevotella sp.]|nr:anaerobic sulfatase-maturation protein [Prevotella sp.]